MGDPRVVVHRSDGVAEIIRGETVIVEDPHPGEWIGYAIFRADGWPLCPQCGEDELYSLELPKATVGTIVGCYACSWKPPASPSSGADKVKR